MEPCIFSGLSEVSFPVVGACIAPMITAVIVLNCLLALTCLGFAWRLWKLRHSLRQLRWMMGDVAHNTEAALQGATDAMISGQQSTQRLQWRYRNMQAQLDQLKRLLIVASWGQGLLLKTMGRRKKLGLEGPQGKSKMKNGQVQ